MANSYASYTTGMDARYTVNNETYLAQTFIPSVTNSAYSVKLRLGRYESPGAITAGIYATTGGEPVGVALCTGTTDGDTLPVDPENEIREIVFTTNPSLTAGTTYGILIICQNAGTTYAKVAYDSTASTYANGTIYTGIIGSWVERADKDIYFIYYGTPAVVPPSTDVYINKQLVEIGSNEVWYESSSGTMEVLSDSVGDLDTSAFLSTAEGYGKLFIANGSNLKIADFINIKITTANQGTNPPDFGTILTGATSGATMSVDYITSYTGGAACTIYGKQTSVADFTDETVTGTDDDSNAISFTGTAQVSGPHWYDWTVFGQSSTFGTMPDTAILVARYRGRLVLSGNEDAGNQWYMSKIGNPFNFIYSATDPLSAVAGQDADAGLVGDVVNAMIAYGDDFLVFGCSASIHILDGDPLFAGSIDELDNTTGMYGNHAWCKDNIGNLYFFGLNGIYVMDGGRSRPQNISLIKLPNLISDWALNPAIHRVVLSFDPKRDGIIISKTTLANGTNLNYWYSLKTKGFYPETYPEEAAIFSSFNYESNDPNYREFIIGSNDGYLRYYLNTAKNDDAGASDETISSYVALPIEPLSEDSDKQGKITSLTFELAGGAAAGDFTDTDSLSYEIHTGNDAETCLEKIKNGSTAFASGTLNGTGRKNRIRVRARAAWLGIKLYNSTVSESWAINRVFGEIKPAGRIK